MSKLTRPALRAWLASQPKTRVFKTYDPRACPIASFLKEAQGASAPYVGVNTYSRMFIGELISETQEREELEKPLPAFAVTLVRALDHGFYGPLNGPQVVELLDAIASTHG